MCMVQAPPSGVPQRQTKTGKKGEVHTDGDYLHNTPKHIAICGAAGTLVAINTGMAIGRELVLASSLGTGAWHLALSGLVAYALADFGTGVYHWAVDNYGDRNTPVFGYQIDAFQGHHKSPWTITERGVFNNVHKACVPALPQLALLVLGSQLLPPALVIFWNTFLASVIMSQEIHKWAHMIQPPKFVVALQDAGILLSRRAHGLHHSSPFEGNYCIVSGWFNGLLDKTGFFRFLEEYFYRRNGAVPNTWKLDEQLDARERLGGVQ